MASRAMELGGAFVLSECDPEAFCKSSSLQRQSLSLSGHWELETQLQRNGPWLAFPGLRVLPGLALLSTCIPCLGPYFQLLLPRGPLSDLLKGAKVSISLCVISVFSICWKLPSTLSLRRCLYHAEVSTCRMKLLSFKNNF